MTVTGARRRPVALVHRADVVGTDRAHASGTSESGSASAASRGDIRDRVQDVRYRNETALLASELAASAFGTRIL